MAESSQVERWRRIGGEFGRLTSAEIDAWITDAALQLDVSAYGNNIEPAKVYLGCHMLKMTRLAEEGKAPLLTDSDEDAWLRLTHYGRQVIALRQQSAESGITLLSILTV